jgi:putative nucleotidyltransferase with HDIG domain
MEIIMTDNVRKTISFIKEQFESVEEFRNDKYRYEHSLRVGAIGERIAKAEGLDVEGLTIACLLHDIGYIECKTEDDYNTHGRISERIARVFLETLQFDKERIESICYGIRIHTDSNEDILREPTPFELSVQTADNIDRFDAYRLYLNLQYTKVEGMTPKEIIECADIRIERYTKYLSMDCGTKTGSDLWKDVLNYQIEYFKRLKEQMVIGEMMEQVDIL